MVSTVLFSLFRNQWWRLIMPDLNYVNSFTERRISQIQKRVELLEKEKGQNESDSVAVAEIKRTFKGFSEDIKALHQELDNLTNAVSVNSKIKKLL